MDRMILVVLCIHHPEEWSFALGMRWRTGWVTRSEPRRSLEDPGYLGMSLTHQRDMWAGWH